MQNKKRILLWSHQLTVKNKGEILFKIMNRSLKVTYPDYKKIKKESCHFDCTITEADFNTSHPNPRRIVYTASDINRYLNYKNGGRV